MPEQESRIEYNTPVENSLERMGQFVPMAEAIVREIHELALAQTEKQYRKRLYHLSELAGTIRNLAVVEYHRFDKPLAVNGKLTVVHDDGAEDLPQLPDEY